MRGIALKIFFNKFLIVLVMATLLVHQQLHAQAVPVANFYMNRAIASIVTRVAVSRGFAANDPKIAATLTSMGEVSTALNVASTAAGIGLAVMGAPVWLTVLAGLGVIGVGMAITGSMGDKQIAMSVADTPDGKKLMVDVPHSEEPIYEPPPLADQTPRWAQAASQGGPIYRRANACYANEPCFALPLPPDIPSYQYVADSMAKTILVTTDLDNFGYWYTFLKQPQRNPETPSSVVDTWQYAGSEIVENSSGGKQITVYIHEARSGGDAIGLPSFSRTNTYSNVGYVYGNIDPQYYEDLDSAYNNMSSELTAQISAESLANIVNTQWQLAATQNGYSGLPYSATQPITAGEVQQWINENPSAAPIFNDLLTPASNPGTTTVIISPTVSPGVDPGTSPGTNPSTGIGTDVNVVNTPNVNVINDVSVDFGPNPGIGSPSLENTPTAQMILQPLLDLFPSLRNFVVPPHSSECPKPSISIFGKSIVMDAHCTVTEAVRPTLYAVMALVWILIAMFIILAA